MNIVTVEVRSLFRIDFGRSLIKIIAKKHELWYLIQAPSTPLTVRFIWLNIWIINYTLYKDLPYGKLFKKVGR